MNAFQGSSSILPTVSLNSLSIALVHKYRARVMMWKLVAIKKKREVIKTTNRTVISILFSLASISVTISLNKHNVQNHFLDLAGSEKLTATWKSCIMNVNICHLQVSHSQTLIQPRAGCGEGGGGGRSGGKRKDFGEWKWNLWRWSERCTAALKALRLWIDCVGVWVTIWMIRGYKVVYKSCIKMI